MTPAAVALSTASRSAGSILVGAWVFGIVPGTVVSVIGGFALVTFGRALGTRRTDSLQSAAGLAVFALGLLVVAKRWGSLELADITGAQAVLGPSLFVAPDEIAVGLWLAALAAVIGAVLFAPTAGGWRIQGWLESALLLLATTTMFAGPALGSGGLTEPGLIWLAGGVSIGIATALGARALRRAAPPIRGGIAAGGCALVAAGAFLVGA